MSEIAGKLNKYKLKSKKQIETAVTKACKGKDHFFDIEIIEDKEIVRKQIGGGKSGPNTKYREEELVSYRLEFGVNEEAVRLERRTDGLFSPHYQQRRYAGGRRAQKSTRIRRILKNVCTPPIPFGIVVA
ncbi:MAG: hypothetical protein HC880_17500 [Bacteroidia bacterium]|nr:hypothetical protein [Bacteroidia bacterium]